MLLLMLEKIFLLFQGLHIVISLNQSYFFSNFISFYSIFFLNFSSFLKKKKKKKKKTFKGLKH